MEFHINKQSTLPVLRMELINDGRNDFNHFYELVQNSIITFSMTDIITGVRRISRKLTGTELVDPSCDEKYYLIYQFTERETEKAGRYIAQFTIEFLDGTGTLIVPIREQLFVNILDSDIRKG